MNFLDGKTLAERYDSNTFRLLRDITADTFVILYGIADGPPCFQIKWSATIADFSTGGQVEQSLPWGSPIVLADVDQMDWFVRAYEATLTSALDSCRRFARMKGVRPY